MTTRERWLIAALVVLGLALGGVFLWGQVRYSDAQSAVNQYVQLEAQARKDEGDEKALARQARPEIRNLMLRGEFPRALKRIRALQAEDSAPADPEIHGTGVSADALWPPKSAEREKARQVLRSLVEKQKQGYELAPAQAQLNQVAEAARRGKRKEALTDFKQVEALVQNAPLRPGFQAPKSIAATPPGDAEGQPLTPEQMAKLTQFVQFLRVALPRMKEAEKDPEKRRFLDKLQPLGDELTAAYQQHKDLRVAAPLVEKLFQSYKDNDLAAADRYLTQVRDAIRNAKPLPAGTPGLTAPPGGPGGPPWLPGSQPPAIPPAGQGTPGAPGAGIPAEKLLQALDGIRKLPEPVYQAQRSQIALFLSSALGRMGQGPGGMAGAPGAPAPALGVGDPASLRLEFNPLGQIAGVRARNQELSPALPAGGFALALGTKPELPLRGLWKPEKDGLSLRAAGPEGVFTASCRQEGPETVIRSQTRRDRVGEPGALLLRIPLRAAGWRWGAGPEAPVVALDGAYAAAPAADGKLAPVTLRGPGLSLILSAPSASAVSYDPVNSWLLVRLPIGKEKGETEHAVRLALERGPDKTPPEKPASELPGKPPPPQQ